MERAGKIAAGALTGAYEATRFKNTPAPAQLEALAVLGAGAGAEAGIKRAAALARGNILARCVGTLPYPLPHAPIGTKLVSCDWVCMHKGSPVPVCSTCMPCRHTRHC